MVRLDWQPGLDIEIDGHGPFWWTVFERDAVLAQGSARTLTGARWRASVSVVWHRMRGRGKATSRR